MPLLCFPPSEVTPHSLVSWPDDWLIKNRIREVIISAFILELNSLIRLLRDQMDFELLLGEAAS